MAKTKTPETIVPELKLIRTDIKFLTCKLSQQESEAAGHELADVTSKIAGEKDRQKAISTELKATMAALVSKQTVLSSRIIRGEEERNVNVRVELTVSGKIIETREDTNLIIAGPRDALPGELQLPMASKLEEELKDAEAKKTAPGAAPAEPPKV
ncbi:MAG: hypothetical protein WC455_16335 [Dehalococcoidia bacterium]|jgi:hypothetical protein